ncbi:Fpg/Nei family DNA glycosylase [Streptomyces spirodelae]|uniref:DNA-(apurinic or apyrimidinic site) lyase n=1 Tax=Streptomyces spirodelae TaxID=2812904 RepID=A0ABS3X1Y2_9ACTN|nr:Fpg/Nei family DNA glycosylase [Streptomyces spirodelae]MBO8189082.1 Fpg/Nei family DNA glycosylase [Streptomyces spirodelae]
MPEGDTVWRTARTLHSALAGHALTRTDFRVPRLATVDLSGRTLLDVTPRGKHLLMRIEGGLTVHSHLGMEGAWRVRANPAGKDSLSGGFGPSHQIRALLATGEHTAAGIRLPVLELLRTVEEFSVVGHLGPDLLGPDWDAAEAERRLLRDPERPLVEALLDQRNLAGIGNVYAAELCFLARTSPWAPVGSLPHPLPARLLAAAKRLLEANKDSVRRRTTNSTRPDRNLAVYGRENRPCYRCGAPVRTGPHGPPERPRTVWYCPHCQPPPASASRKGPAAAGN